MQKWVYRSVYTEVVIKQWVHKNGYTTACIRQPVYKSVHTKVGIQKYKKNQCLKQAAASILHPELRNDNTRFKDNVNSYKLKQSVQYTLYITGI